MPVTNRGKFLIFQGFVKGTVPTNFYMALGSSLPTVDTNTLGELTQVGTTNTGYTDGGASMSRNGTDFPTLNEDDTNNYAEVGAKTMSWTAGSAGFSCRYVYLVTDEGTVANRQVIAWHDLGATISVAASQPFNITAFTVRISYTSGWTNKGLARALNVYFRATNVPTQFYCALITNATVPDDNTNTFSQLTEVAAGNGYTAGGLAVTRDATGWPTLTEDDANDRLDATMQSKSFTASGGNLPASGSGASYAIITDDNVTQGSREVIAFTTLGGTYTVVSGNSINVNNWPWRLT